MCPEADSFDVSNWAQSNNLQITGGSPGGMVTVVDQNPKSPTFSQQADFNPREYLVKNGMDPKQAAKLPVQVNTPDNPVPISPVGLDDRMAISFGQSAEGSIKYLKNKYEDAALNKDADLTVKSNGVWHKVQAYGDGTGYDYAKSIADTFLNVKVDPKDYKFSLQDPLRAAADLSGHAPGVAASLATATVLEPIAAGVGAATFGAMAPQAQLAVCAASGASGALVNSISKNILGRYAGTYDATPEQALKDAGMDLTLSMASCGIPLGMKKAVVPVFQKAFETLSEKASPYVKNVLESVISHAANVTPEDTALLLDETKSVVAASKARIASLVEKGITPTDDKLAAAHTDEMMPMVKKALAQGRAYVGDKFASMRDAAMSMIPSSFDAAEAKTGVAKGLEDFKGLGLFQQASKGNMYEDGVAEYTPIPKADFIKLAAKFNMSEGVADDLYPRFAKFSGNAKAFLNDAKTGVDGAKQLSGLKQGLNDFYFGMVNSLAEDSPEQKAVQKLLTPVTGPLHEALSTSISKAGEGGQKLIDAGNYWANAIPFMDKADKVVNGSIDRLYTFTKQLGAKAERTTARNTISNLTDEETAKKIFTTQASGAFDKMLPQMHHGDGSAGTTLRTIGGYIPVVSPTSPRNMAGAVNAADSAKQMAAQGTLALRDTVRTLSETDLGKMLQDPKYLNAALQSIMTSSDPSQHKMQADQMLQQAGLKQ